MIGKTDFIRQRMFYATLLMDIPERHLKLKKRRVLSPEVIQRISPLSLKVA
jgi:hypothetical protein